jgi:hypothetical protein
MSRICSTCKVREAKKGRHRCDACLHPVDTCPLCLEVKPLIDSHLLPRRLYSLLDNVGVYVAEEGTGTLRQISKHLFCGDCDNKINTNGENWTLNYCYRPDSRKWRGPEYKFRLRDEVLKNGPAPMKRGMMQFWDDGQPELVEIYSATANPKIRWEVLAYFAISVFWRATVTVWLFEGVKGGKYRIPMSGDLERSRTYQEQMHRYLVTGKEEDFPKDMTLRVHVHAADHPSLTTNLPGIDEGPDGIATFTFQIPGIGFELCIGEKQHATCIVRGIEHPIIKSNFMDQYTMRRTREMFLSLPAAEQAKLLEKADALKEQMRAAGYDTSDVTEVSKTFKPKLH